MTPLLVDEAGVEGLGSGVTDGLPEVGAVVVCALFDGVADAATVGVWPAQLASGVGLWLVARLDALARVLADAFVETLPVAMALALPLSVGVAVALVDALPFGLALALAVSPGLAVSLLSDGLAVLGDAVTLGLVGAPVDPVDRVGLDAAGFGELDVCDGDGDTHGTADGEVIPGVALPSTALGPELWPVPPGAAELAVLLGEPANTSVLTWTNACRSGGTAASTTATANTATPMPSAGRSMASRQFTGQRWAGRACPGAAPRPGVLPRRSGAPWPRGALCSPRAPDRRRTRSARTPQPQRARVAPGSGSAAEA